MPLMPRLEKYADRMPAVSAFNRRVLDVLVVMNVVTQAVLVLLLVVDTYGTKAAPVAGGATVAMFLLAYFYARWLLPVLDRRHVLAVLLVKEMAVILFLGLAAGLIWLVSLVVDLLA